MRAAAVFLSYLLFGSFFLARAQAPAITSFSPTTVCQGEPITITGSNFTGATAVKAGSLSVKAFTVNSATSITAVVADLATNGTISVTTPNGTGTSAATLTILPAPRPSLTDVGTLDAPFTNCDGNATYQLKVSNASIVVGTGNAYKIDWGDNTAPFTQTDWPSGAQTTHTYTAQGYFQIVMTITPANGCTKTVTYRFYNGQNPLASFTTTQSTTGLCVPAPIEFQIGNWFNNSAGTTYDINFGDGTPHVTLTHPLNAANTIQLLTHTYNTSSCPNPDFTATLNATNGCFTTTYTLNQIIIRKPPVADFSFQTNPACLDAGVCFVNQTANGYSGNSCSTTSTYLWDFGDGATSTSAAPSCHNYAAAGTYTVTLTASNLTCGSSNKTKQVTVLPTSPPPAVAAGPLVYCQGQQAAALTATGTGLLWYTTATGGTGSATAPIPPTAMPGTRTYYVSQTLTNECESPRVAVIVTVNALPAAPGVTTPVTVCLNQAAAPLTAVGSNLLWYTSASGGTGSSTAPVPSTATAGSTTYYVSQTINGCEGPRAAIVVTVNTVAAAPQVVSPVTYCQHQAAVPLTAVGSNLLWYTSATGGTGSSTAPVPSTATAGSTTYYVSQLSGCGESPRSAITVNVNASPSASISYAPATLCNVVNSATTPNPPVTVVQTGSTGGTYSISPATGLPIDPATGQINPSGAIAGTYTISYSVPGTGGCGVFTTTTTVTVSGTPAATFSYTPLCTSDAATKPTFSGTMGGAFSSTTGLAINAVTGAVTPAASQPGTYTVTYTVQPSSPCPGFTTTAQVTVSQAPSATISYTPAMLCNVVNSATTPNPPVAVVQTGSTGGTYSVSPVTGLAVDPATGQINPSGAIAGIYIITYSVPGTGGCGVFTTTTTVTVNGTPAATFSYTPLCTSDAATKPTFSGTMGGAFSSTTGLTINAVTGAVTPAASQPGTYTVTYTVQPSSPCPGFTTTAQVTVSQAPSATISYTPATLCNVVNSATTPNSPVSVIQTGTTGGTYSVSPVTGLAVDPATGQINPSGATAGTYTIRYTVLGQGGCANYAATTTVVVNSMPTATINYPGSPFCQGITALQKVSLSGTPGGTFSSPAGLSINPTTGDVNPSVSQPGTYTVVYTIAPSAPCPGFTTSTTVIIDASPVLTFPQDAQSICSGGTAIFLPHSSVPNTNYAWSVAGALPPDVTGVAAGSVSGPNPAISLTFVNTGVSSQTIKILVTPTNPSTHPCTGTAYTLTLTVNPIPPAPAAATTDLCMGSPATTLSVSPQPGATIHWYDENLVLLNGPPTISTGLPGQFTYYVNQTNGYGCTSPNGKITAVVHPTPKIVSSAYTNPVTCGIPSGSIVLNLLDLNDNALPNLPLIIHYDKFQLPYTIAETTDANGKVTIPLTAGTYSDIYVEAAGCLSGKIPDVFVLKDPSPPAAPVAGYNPPLCSESILNLTALSATSPQTGDIQYVWAGPAFGPYPDTVTNTVISFPSAPASYEGTYVVYAMQNNCISLPTNFAVTIKQSPSKPVITTRNPLCVGDDLYLQASSSFPGQNNTLTYEWRGPGRGFPVDGPTAGIHSVKVEDGGIYSITVTAPQTGCSVTIDTLIRIGAYPIVKFARDSLTLPTGYLLHLDPVILNAADPGILPMQRYEWTPDRDLSCNDAICSSPVATIKNDVCYSVKAVNVYGCAGSDTMCVKVFCEHSQIFIPNAFTPKGSIAGNRKLVVRASGISSVRSFRVFNRWGKIVFERDNFPPNSPDYGWDGTVNGRPADQGVYVYTAEVVCENGVPYTYKGNVTLIY